MEELIFLSYPNEHANIVQCRNLRAKLRSILPQKFCSKYQHRSKRLMQALEKKNQYHKCQKPHQYSSISGIQNKTFDYYIEYFHRQPTKNIFTKLKNDEIQRICENKYYFLGDTYTQSFNTYLKQKEDQQKNQHKIKIIHNQSVTQQNLSLAKYRFNSLKRLPTIKSNQSRLSPEENKSLQICKRDEFRNKRQNIYRKYKQNINTQIFHQDTKLKKIQCKLLKANKNMRNNQKKFYKSVQKKHQKMKKMKERVLKMHQLLRQQGQFNRLASDLKRICGSQKISKIIKT